MKNRKIYLLGMISLLAIIIVQTSCIPNKKNELTSYKLIRDELLDQIINAEASQFDSTKVPTKDSYIKYLNAKTDSLYKLLFSQINIKQDFIETVKTTNDSKIIVKYIPHKLFKITINHYDKSEICETYYDNNLNGFDILEDKYIRIENDKSFRTPLPHTVDIIEFNNLLRKFIENYNKSNV